MKLKKVKQLMAILCVSTLLFTGCGTNTSQTSNNKSNTSTSANSSTEAVTVSTVSKTSGEYKSEYIDESWDENSVSTVALSDDEIKVSGNGVSVSDNVVTISSAGTYVISGTVNDGQIVVNSKDDEDVRIILNGAEITCSDGPAINCTDAKNLVITLAKGTTNKIADGSSRTDETLKAAIFSKADLILNGSGTLDLTANYKNGIQSKDDLVIIDGTYNITSQNTAILGKDSVCIRDGKFKITSSSDGIKSTNTEDTSKGYVIIDGGDYVIESVNDGIQAMTELIVNDGTFDITCNEGSENSEAHTDTFIGGTKNAGTTEDGTTTQSETENGTTNDSTTTASTVSTAGSEITASTVSTASTTDDSTVDTTDDTTASTTDDTTTESTSAKALKSDVNITVNGGTFTINSSDDALHSANDITVNGGTFTISTGDDAVHADSTIEIEGGKLDINTCYEGLEAKVITMDDGDVNIVSQDDGINATDGTGSEDANGDIVRGDMKNSTDSSNAVSEDGSTPPDMPEDGNAPTDIPEDGSTPPDMEQDKGAEADAGDTSSSTYSSESDSSTDSSADSSTDTAAPGGGGMMDQAESGVMFYMNGGTLTIQAGGDGVDSNGSAQMSGGTLIVYGPENSGNGSLDYNGTFEVSGGTLLIAGSSGMAQYPSDTSTQNTIAMTYDTNFEAGTKVTLKDSSGNEITTFTSTKQFNCVEISTPDITKGETYTISVGDSESSEVTVSDIGASI